MKQIETEAELVRDWDKKTCLAWWDVSTDSCRCIHLALILFRKQDSKDQLIKHEYENNARKRRKIEKDKHDFDMPKPSKLASFFVMG